MSCNAALAPTANTAQTEEAAAAERVVVTEWAATGATFIAAAVSLSSIRAINVAIVGAVGDPEFGVRVVALEIGDTRLTRREAPAGLVEVLTDTGTGRNRAIAILR